MYTSGRTVKSSKRAKPSTVVSATRDARKLVSRYLPGVEGITITSTLTAHPTTLAPQVRTMITWPGDVTPAHVQLGAAIVDLSGYLGAFNDNSSIVYLRAI